jgi:hypothetical protein
MLLGPVMLLIVVPALRMLLMGNHDQPIPELEGDAG